jgi:hypothetical protein
MEDLQKTANNIATGNLMAQRQALERAVSSSKCNRA